MTDLAALIERLEKLTGPDREVDFAIHDAFDPPKSQQPNEPDHPEPPEWFGKDAWSMSMDTRPRYTASLDAVIALVERELPGMAWTLGQNVHHRYWVASLNRLNDEGAPESIAWGQSNQPVIALLLALLRAKGGDNG